MASRRELEEMRNKILSDRQEKERRLSELNRETNNLRQTTTDDDNEEAQIEKNSRIEALVRETTALMTELESIPDEFERINAALNSLPPEETPEDNGLEEPTDNKSDADKVPPEEKLATQDEYSEKIGLAALILEKYQTWKSKWIKDIQATEDVIKVKLDNVIGVLENFHDKGYLTDSDVDLELLKYKREHVQEWTKLMKNKAEEVLSQEQQAVDALTKMGTGAQFDQELERWYEMQKKIEAFAIEEERFLPFWKEWNKIHGKVVDEKDLRVDGYSKKDNRTKQKQKPGKADFPLSDSRVLVELKGAEKRAAVAAAAVEVLKRELAQYVTKDNMKPEDIKAMESKQKELMERMNEFEEITKKITELVGLVEVASSQILQPSPTGYGMVNPEDVLPKVIVCGAANFDQVPKIIVCETNTTGGKQPEFPVLDGQGKPSSSSRPAGLGSDAAGQGLWAPGKKSPAVQDQWGPGGSSPRNLYPGMGNPGLESLAPWNTGGQNGDAWRIMQMSSFFPPMPLCPSSKKLRCKKKHLAEQNAIKTQEDGKRTATVVCEEWCKSYLENCKTILEKKMKESTEGEDKDQCGTRSKMKPSPCNDFCTKNYRKPKKKPKKCFCQIYGYCPR